MSLLSRNTLKLDSKAKWCVEQLKGCTSESLDSNSCSSQLPMHAGMLWGLDLGYAGTSVHAGLGSQVAPHHCCVGGHGFLQTQAASVSRNGSEGIQHMFIDTDHYSHASSKKSTAPSDSPSSELEAQVAVGPLQSSDI